MLSSTKSRFAGKNLSQLFFAFLILQFTTLAQYGWVKQTSGTTANLNSVFFVSSNVGWAVGDVGTIIHTTDGGNNWSPQASNITDNLGSVRFTDDNTGWIDAGHANTGQTLKTTNGGEDWIILNAPSPTASYFLTNVMGWIYHGGNISKTTDGGQSWITLYTWSPLVYFYIDDMYFVNENLGFIHGYWEGMNPPGAHYRTTDGGYNWEPTGFSPSNSTFDASLCFLDNSIGWAACTSSCIFIGGFVSKTEDAGESWEEQLNIGRNFADVYFANYDKGWAIDGNSIWFTGDGGGNWNTQSYESIPSWYVWHSIYFSDENSGWIVCDSGAILNTTTGGIVSVEEEVIYEIPTNYILNQNYPNPFNPSTRIKYSVPQSSNVIIKVFDILGNEIEALVNEEKSTGTYELTWYATNLPSGVYFYRLRAGSFVETKKMILMK